MTFASARLLPALGAAFAASVLFVGAACKPAPKAALAAAAEPTPASKAAPSDWPMFGGTIGRNLANSVEKNMPDTWSVKKKKEMGVKWKAQLGGTAFGGPVISGGRIFIGMNNDKPLDPNITGDKGIMACFNEADGAFLWQIVHDKLDDKDLDAGDMGIASAPAVDGDRLYYVSNRCELVCADVAGDAAQKGKGKIVWSLDMIKDLKVYPGGIEGGLANCSPLVLDDLVYVVTSNGVDGHTGKPQNPDAPSFLAVHKADGTVAWSSNLPGANILDGQWGNPAAAVVNGEKEVIFPGGDGWLYGFEAKKGDLLWKFDCNPKKSEFRPKQGKGTRNYIVSTPVVMDGKVYVGVGREPDADPGPGHFWCIDITKTPKDPKTKDLSPVNDNFDAKAPENKDSGLVWHYGGVYDDKNPKPANAERDYICGHILCTAAVHDGLVYVSELEGFLHCLDAQTGKEYWQHDLGGGAWGSPYYVDGKVYMGVDNADLFVFAAGKEDKQLSKIEMLQGLKVPPVAANGVLYINNGSTLYAIAPK
jgi:outer membrane protein assembly factor BamB